MDFDGRAFEVEFTEQCIEEMIEIYDYIANKLKESESAKKIINEVNERILGLASFPESYMKTGKADKLKRDYRRIVVKKYVVLYTIDYENEKVFIVHMRYGGKEYLY